MKNNHKDTEADANGAGIKRTQLTQEQFKQAVLNGKILYAVSDSGVTANCVKPQEQQTKVSVPGSFRWNGKPYTFLVTLFPGQKSCVPVCAPTGFFKKLLQKVNVKTRVSRERWLRDPIISKRSSSATVLTK